MILAPQSGKKLLVSGLSGCFIPLYLIFGHLADWCLHMLYLNAGK